MPETIWDVADFYDLLSVSRSATSEQIRAAVTAQRRIWVRRQSSPDQGKWDRAVAEFEYVLERSPNDIDAAQTMVTLSYGPRIGSRRQWRIVGDRLRRIKRLRMKDPRTKVVVGQLKELRQRVRRRRWEMVMSPGIDFALVVAAWLPSLLMGFRRFGIEKVPRRPPPVRNTPEIQYQPLSSPYPFD